MTEAKKAKARDPRRRYLPNERSAINHSFSIAGYEGNLIVGLQADGSPGEIFIEISKEGSTVSGAFDAWATAMSVALQYGWSVEAMFEKFAGKRFEPFGYTANPEIPECTSIVDYVVRFLALRFPGAPPKAGG